MDFVNSMINFLSDKQFSVPLGQMLLFAFMISICFFLSKHKMGLLISYTFVFYWGFFFNRGFFIDILGYATTGFFIYVFSGVITATLIFIGFFREE
ncbi:MAG: hypothetical protein ACE5G9_08165 [Nitrospinales bacterium]